MSTAGSVVYVLHQFDKPMSTLIKRYGGNGGPTSSRAIYVQTLALPDWRDLEEKDSPTSFEARWNDAGNWDALKTAIPVAADPWLWNQKSVAGKTIQQVRDEIYAAIKAAYDANERACRGTGMDNPGIENPVRYHFDHPWTAFALWRHPRNVECRSSYIVNQVARTFVKATWNSKATDEQALSSQLEDDEDKINAIKFGHGDTFMYPSPDVPQVVAGVCSVGPRNPAEANRAPQVLLDEPAWVTQLKAQLKAVTLATNFLSWKNGQVQSIHDDIWSACSRVVLMRDVASVFAGLHSNNSESQLVLSKANALLASPSWQTLLAAPQDSLEPTLLSERLAARDALWKVVRENPELDRLTAKLIIEFPDKAAPAPDADRLWIDVIDDILSTAVGELMLADVDEKTLIEITALLEPAVLEAPAPVTTHALATFVSYTKKAKFAMGLAPKMITSVMISRIAKEGADIAGQAQWKVMLEQVKTKILVAVMTKPEFDDYEAELNKVLDKVRGNPEAIKAAKTEFKARVGKSRADGGLKPDKFTDAKWQGVMAIFNIIGLVNAANKGTSSAQDFCGLIGATEATGRSVLKVLDAWKPNGDIGVFVKGTEKISASFGAVLGILTGVVQIADGLQTHNTAAVVAGGLTVGGGGMILLTSVLELNPIVGLAGTAIMFIANLIDTDDSAPPAQRYLTEQFERTADIDWAHGTTCDHYAISGEKASAGATHFRAALDKDPGLFHLYADFYRAVMDKANRAAFKAPGCPNDGPLNGSSIYKYYGAEATALKRLGVTYADTARMLRGN